MRQTFTIISKYVAPVVVIAYSTLSSGKLFFGLVSAVVLYTTVSRIEQETVESAAAVGVPGSIVAAGFWTERLEIIAIAVVAAVVLGLVSRSVREQSA